MKKNQTSNETQNPKFRIITAPQSTGRIGKSTLMCALHAFLNEKGIKHTAIDADGEHLTMSKHYSDNVFSSPYKDRESLAAILEEVLIDPVTLIDFPAQITSQFISGLEGMKSLDFLENKEARFTIFIFASDERAAMKSAADLIKFFDGRADFIKVYNPARSKSDEFDTRPLFAKIKNEIRLPKLTDSTLKNWSARQQADQKMYSLEEFAVVASDTHSAYEVRQWLSKVTDELLKVKHLINPTIEGEPSPENEGFKGVGDFDY